MKLVGSYTSPFVRKLSILLLEKGITFEFINELPYNADNGVAQFNPLGKVPVLVTEEGECWFDSPIIAEYIEPGTYVRPHRHPHTFELLLPLRGRFV
ncbi:glutathione S-transferase N-terminal domain-containing protein, partial [Escherichia coli]|nr:glutathione S-transferase N-terminal domain-containing protein [Escherichia coli]